MVRPRAADDYPAIKARIDELRHECAVATDSERQTVIGLSPYAVSNRHLDEPWLRAQLLRAVRRQAMRG